MAQTDVKLVIKARNDASAAVIAVADAIKTLTGAQDKLASGSGATSSLLDQLKNASTALAAAIQKTDDAVERSQAAFERQQQTLVETEAQLAAVKAQMAAAEASATALNAAIKAGGEGASVYEAKLAGVVAEQKNLSAQASKLTSSINSQQAALAKSSAGLQQMQSAGRSAGSAATFALVTPEAVAVTNEAAASATRLASSLPPIAPAAQRAGQGARALGAQIRDLALALLTVPKAEKDAEGSLTAFGGSSRTALSLSQRLRAEVLSLTQTFIGLYAAVGAVRAVLDAYQALQSAENKLGVVFNQNERQVSNELEFLRGEAVRLGLSFTQLADQYSAFAIAAQSAGFTLEGTRKVFLAVADASRVLHLSTDQVNNVFLALTEMLSKGEIQSTQLRKQLGTDLPGAVSLFADALGISTKKLDELMQRGELLADEETFSKVADRLNEKYGKQLPQALQTAQTQMGRFQALLQSIEIDVGKGGFIEALNSGLRQLNDYLKTEDAKEFFTEVGADLGKLVGLLPVVVRNFGLITAAFKLWSALKVDMWLLGLVSKFETAATAARAMWTAVGGVPGLLLTGAAFALEGFVGKWASGVDTATAALSEHQRILDAVKKGYDDAGGAVDNWAKKIKGATEVEAVAILQKLQAALADVKSQMPSAPALVSTGSDIPDLTAESPLAKQLDDIIQKFRDGKSSYDDFKKAISGFGVAHKEFQDFTVQLLDGTKRFGELQDAVKQVKAELNVLRGTATAADIKALGLEAADGWSAATASADKFTDALDKMQKTVPDLEQKLGFQTKLDTAKNAYTEAVKAALYGLAGSDPVSSAIAAATTAAKLAEAKQVYDAVVEKIHAYAAADQAKNFPLDNKAIIERIIYVESNGSVTAKNPNSSAYGIGQFTNATWLQIFDQIRPALADLSDAAKLSLRSNETMARDALDLLTKQNQLALANAGIPVTAANTYLAHLLGAQGAIKMILANPDELASKIAGAAASKANPSILGGGRSVADVLGFAAAKMGSASPITSSGATEQEAFNASLQEQTTAWQDDAKAIALARGQTDLQANATARALAVQKDLDEWTKRATADHTTLTADQRKAIEAAAGADYDQKNLAQDAQKIIEQIVALSEQRSTAIQEFHTALSDGSSAQNLDNLRQKINELTAALIAALPSAQSLAGTLGNERMVESLQRVSQQLQNVKVGLTDAAQMNTLVAETAVSAWGTFNSTLTQTHNIFTALKTSFLTFAQDFLTKIEEMLLKQEVLNALSGTGIGSFLSKTVNAATGTDAAGSGALTAAGETLSTAGAALGTAAADLVAAATALQTSSFMSSFANPSNPQFADAALTILGEFHSGGIVGKGGRPRTAAAAIFAGAQRFHSGGLPGLRPNEVPAILEKGEEVLTRNNPRHVLNGGGKTANADGLEIHIFNGLDPAEMVSKGLGSGAGVKAVMNLITANKGAIRAALS